MSPFFPQCSEYANILVLAAPVHKANHLRDRRPAPFDSASPRSGQVAGIRYRKLLFLCALCVSSEQRERAVQSGQIERRSQLFNIYRFPATERIDSFQKNKNLISDYIDRIKFVMAKYLNVENVPLFPPGHKPGPGGGAKRICQNIKEQFCWIFCSLSRWSSIKPALRAYAHYAP